MATIVLITPWGASLESLRRTRSLERRKLGVKNRTEATRFAYQQGLVESPLYDAE